ncbi:hypothetical protein [Xenorhabdus szentirmaii]|uniref:hypothetical protein n=1 Tax=Xenorhabdus szentirmaii TaxID=290112 RepID=UPI00117DAC02|nr:MULTISPECIES: hypothetical protein [Xenorhabdus]MBD2825670.1 hypothetical protein [Xenorhabdus sp. 5]
MHDCTKTPPCCVRARRGSNRAQGVGEKSIFWGISRKSKMRHPRAPMGRSGAFGVSVRMGGGEARKVNTARLSENNRRCVRYGGSSYWPFSASSKA